MHERALRHGRVACSFTPLRAQGAVKVFTIRRNNEVIAEGVVFARGEIVACDVSLRRSHALSTYRTWDDLLHSYSGDRIDDLRVELDDSAV
jgi:hypothetical protein